MGVRTQWVTGRPETGRLAAELEALGGQLLGRSQYEPVPWDLDEFGTMDGELFGIVGLDLERELVLEGIERAIDGLDPGHALVLDFSGGAVQVRRLPTRGGWRMVVKAGSGVHRFDKGRERHARQLIRGLLRRLARP
jgi:hypothetical protein